MNKGQHRTPRPDAGTEDCVERYVLEERCSGRVSLRTSLAGDPSSPWQLDVDWCGEARLDRVYLESFLEVFDFARTQAGKLLAFLQRHQPHLQVGRVGLVYDGLEPRLRLVPMTGSDTQHWQAVLAPEERYGDENPDHVDSKSGPRMTRDVLDEWKRRLSPYEGAEDDLTFDGPASDDNLFARIVRGEEEQWRVYQDPSSVAVLTPFPNGPLKTVLVPRHHAASDVLGLDRAEFLALLRSTHSALRIFDRVDAIGVAIVMEGFEIDYAHIKLTPRFHGNKSERCAFTHCYSGFLTSQRGPDLDAKQALDCHRLLVRVWPRD